MLPSLESLTINARAAKNRVLFRSCLVTHWILHLAVKISVTFTSLGSLLVCTYLDVIYFLNEAKGSSGLLSYNCYSNSCS